jgi:hypothetical protein
MRRNNTSGYIGVSRHKASGKWRAQASVNGKVNPLGDFDDPFSAALAYDRFIAPYRPRETNNLTERRLDSRPVLVERRAI